MGKNPGNPCRKLPLVVLVLFLIVPPGVLRGHIQAGPEVEVELSAALSAPGQVVVLPLILRAPENSRLQKVEVEIPLPSEVATLKAARIGKDNEEEGEISHRIEEPSEEGKPPRVIVTVKRKPGVVAGELAKLVLTVGEETPEESYVLPVSVRGWPPGEEADAVKLAGLDGILVVSASAPVFGCFFYMH